MLRATRVGWPTQSSTTALALLLDLATRVGEILGRPGAHRLRAELRTLPDLMAAVIRDAEAPLAAIAEREHASDAFLFSAPAELGARDHRSREGQGVHTGPGRGDPGRGVPPLQLAEDRRADRGSRLRGRRCPGPCTRRARPSASAAACTS